MKRKKLDKFVYVEDSVLSRSYCKLLIKNYSSKTKAAEIESHGYSYVNLEDTPIFPKIVNILKPHWEEYRFRNSGVDYTKDKWGLSSLRFKRFDKGKSFEGWHSEHCVDYPLRVLSVQFYLSEHNCGTEFIDGSVIKSEVGRLAIFPSYFTHCHKGQKCPENKPRYIITGYTEFIC